MLLYSSSFEENLSKPILWDLSMTANSFSTTSRSESVSIGSRRLNQGQSAHMHDRHAQDWLFYGSKDTHSVLSPRPRSKKLHEVIVYALINGRRRLDHVKQIGTWTFPKIEKRHYLSCNGWAGWISGRRYSSAASRIRRFTGSTAHILRSFTVPFYSSSRCLVCRSTPCRSRWPCSRLLNLNARGWPLRRSRGVFRCLRSCVCGCDCACACPFPHVCFPLAARGCLCC